MENIIVGKVRTFYKDEELERKENKESTYFTHREFIDVTFERKGKTEKIDVVRRVFGNPESEEPFVLQPSLKTFTTKELKMIEEELAKYGFQSKLL